MFDSLLSTKSENSYVLNSLPIISNSNAKHANSPRVTKLSLSSIHLLNASWVKFSSFNLKRFKKLITVSFRTLRYWHVFLSSEHWSTIKYCWSISKPPPDVPMKNSISVSLYSSGVIPSSTLLRVIFKFSSSKSGSTDKRYVSYIFSTSLLYWSFLLLSLLFLQRWYLLE